ncbi:MAG: RidA family protein [Solirubrobacteraceae bacterium]
MRKQQINPFTWQESRFSHAWRVDGAQSIVFVSGQGPFAADGSIVGEGDFTAQARRTFENLSVVLEQAGASFGDVIKLTVYLTDMATLPDYGRVKHEFAGSADPSASTVVQVVALARPEMMIEVEATAVV